MLKSARHVVEKPRSFLWALNFESINLWELNFVGIEFVGIEFYAHRKLFALKIMNIEPLPYLFLAMIFILRFPALELLNTGDAFLRSGGDFHIKIPGARIN